MKASPSREPIAIIGTSCRFPGNVENLDDYWNFLISGSDAVGDIPESRWSWEFHYDKNIDKHGKMAVKRGGFLSQDIESFDASFFDISPREAAILDPQQRLLLELTHEALEDAIGDTNKVRGTQTGVYIGAFMLDNMITQFGPGAKAQVGIYTAVSSTMTMISNRLSYAFDLNGPSFTLDTACSSSLVATHQACRGLLSGDCDMAVTGGVSIMFRPEIMMMMSKGRFLSPDGRSKTFSAHANGYGRGEGGGLVVLKRLSDALRDGDNIQGIIRSSGVNQDGNTDGITVPSENAQSALARRVYAEGDIDPAQIGYLEAHGTGTPVGDPIEMNAMGKTVGQARPKDASPLIVGSVKASIGHLEAGAGIAGLLKALLVTKHKTAPPQGWLDTELNPNIDFENLNLRIADQPLTVAQNEEGKALAAINSFGYGGTNAHVVLESADDYFASQSAAPVKASTQAAQSRGYLLNLSGESEEAIQAYAEELTTILHDADDQHAANVCTSLSKKTQHTLRHSLSAPRLSELKQRLASYVSGEDTDGLVKGRAPRQPRKPVMVFSGMGPQWWAMGKELYENEPLFKARLDEADAIFHEISGWSILGEMFLDQEASRMGETEIAQPANFLIQMGLFELLRSWGIEPAAVVGHSVGEVSSGYASGALTLRQALTVAYHRSRTQAKTAGTGGMMAVGMSVADITEVMAPYADQVSIAGINGLSNTTLSGKVDALQEIALELETKGVLAKMLRVEVPYHSAGMDPILDELYESLADLKPSEPSIPLYSTVTGQQSLSGNFDAQYWCDNVREPVYFLSAVEGLLDEGHEFFVEIGPHPVIGGYIKETLMHRGAKGICLSTLNRKEDEFEQVRKLLGNLWANGCALDLQSYLQAPGDLKLPAYKWQRKQHWDEEHFAKMVRQGWPDAHRLLGRQLADPSPTWQTELTESLVSWLPDHKVAENTVFPGAGYVETMLELAKSQAPNDPCHLLRDLRFHRALVLDDQEGPVYRTTLEQDSQIVIHAGLASKSSEWNRHCEATLMSGEYRSADAENALAAPEGAVARDRDTLYAELAKMGLDYSNDFKAIQQLQHNDNTALVNLRVDSAAGYTIHPALLDGAFQAMVALRNEASNSTYLPASVEEIRCFGAAGNECTARVEITQQDAAKMIANIKLVAGDQVVLELIGVRCAAAQLANNDDSVDLDQLSYWLNWRLQDLSDGGEAFENIALIGNPDSAELVSALQSHGCYAVTSYETMNALLSSSDISHYDQVAVFVESNSADAAIEDSALMVLQLQQLSQHLNPAATLSFVTRETQTALFGASVEGFHSSWVIGMRRNIMSEVPELGFARHIDIDATATIDQLAAELATRQPEDEVVLADSGRAVLMVNRLDANEYRSQIPKRTRPFIDRGFNNFILGVPERKTFSALAFVENDRRLPLAHEVEVRVEAASLNFKDVAKILGLLTPEMLESTNSGMTLGLECAGEIVNVGTDVTEFAVGDRVAVNTANCFQRYLTLTTDQYEPNAVAIRKCSDELSYEHASSALITYCTALYTLRESARLQAGETVLIHGGAGGVGTAAIHVAKWLGATVITTAGNEEKRAYCRSIGADHVLNSRDLSFADDVKAITDGHGVDVVLNSIGGGVARASFDALANFGRFIEIGKNDIYAERPMNMAPFERNISYTCVDLDYLTIHRRQLMIDLNNEVFDRIEDGTFPPMPVTVFGVDELSEAFGFLARAKHIGKVVLDFSKTPQVSALRPKSIKLSAEKTVLITGGLGGVGSQMIEWLLANGTRKFALLSRRGAVTEQHQTILDNITRQGAEADVYKADASSRSDLTEVVRQIEAKGVLGGVVHAAGVLDDRPFMEMDEAAIRKVATPKVLGANNLHELTKDNRNLDFFVVLSSVSAVTGHSRQNNYCLANAYMDGLCNYRQSVGLPANSINLGPVAEAGMAVDNEEVGQYLALIGLRGLSNEAMQGAFTRLLEWNLPQLTLNDVDWATWEQSEQRAAKAYRFSEIIESEGAGSGSSSVLTALAKLPLSEQIDTVAYMLAENIAEILQMDSEQVDIEAPLDGFGIDSLTAIEFQLMVKRAFSVELSILSMLSGKTLREVASDVVDMVDFDAEAATPPAPAATASKEVTATDAKPTKNETGIRTPAMEVES